MREVEVAAVEAAPTTWARSMRAALQSVSELDDFRRCGQRWATADLRVVVAATGETRRLGFHSCRSCWVCPVCWSTRRYQERGDLVFAGEQWFGAAGGIERVTLTEPHELGESLADVWARVELASRALRSGRAMAALRDDFGVAHIVRAVEITYGAAGWHPHEHWLLWTRGRWDEPTRAGLWRWWRERRERKRRRAEPTPEPYRPQDVQSVQPADLGAVAGHITKGASRTTEDRYFEAEAAGQFELADYLGQFVPEERRIVRPRPVAPSLPSGPVGRQLAPFEIGELAAVGSGEAAGLWREYEATTRGRQWIRWSNGSRAGFGLGDAGKSAALEGATIYLSGGGGLGRAASAGVAEVGEGWA